MSKLHTILPLAIAAVFVHGAEAQQPSQGSSQQSSATAPVGVAATRTITGTIESIDPSERRVTLRGRDGAIATMAIGPQVKDFNNLKKGDEVTIRYSEAIALALAEGDQKDIGSIRKRVEADAVRQAPPGGKPGLTAMERTTLVANVFKVDRQAGTLTLRGTGGVPVQIHVPNKQSLQGIEENDQVVVSYVEAAALSVERGSSSVATGGKAGEAGSSAAASGGKAVEKRSAAVSDGSAAPHSDKKRGTAGASSVSTASSQSAGGDPGPGSAKLPPNSAAGSTRAEGSPGKPPTPGQPGTK